MCGLVTIHAAQRKRSQYFKICNVCAAVANVPVMCIRFDFRVRKILFSSGGWNLVLLFKINVAYITFLILSCLKT